MFPPFFMISSLISQSLQSYSCFFCTIPAFAKEKATAFSCMKSSWGQQQSGPGSISENLKGFGVDLRQTTAQAAVISFLMSCSQPPLRQLRRLIIIRSAALFCTPVNLLRLKQSSLIIAPRLFLKRRSSSSGMFFQQTSFSFSLRSSCWSREMSCLVLVVLFFMTVQLGGRFLVWLSLTNKGLSSQLCRFFLKRPSFGKMALLTLLQSWILQSPGPRKLSDATVLTDTLDLERSFPYVFLQMGTLLVVFFLMGATLGLMQVSLYLGFSFENRSIFLKVKPVACSFWEGFSHQTWLVFKSYLGCSLNRCCLPNVTTEAGLLLYYQRAQSRRNQEDCLRSKVHGCDLAGPLSDLASESAPYNWLRSQSNIKNND